MQPNMTAPLKHNVLSIRSSAAASGNTTPQSSAYPSAYPSEDEADVKSDVRKPFCFLDLPSELRNKVYGLIFATAPAVLDLDPDNYRNVHRNLAIFFVSRQIHNEASHYFYSTRTVRLFPTHPGRFFKTKKPLLARLPSRYRAAMSTLELRLGPGWSKPPRGWVINEALGLQDAGSVKVLKILVQIDPSDSIFSGFRISDGFYENFSRDLLGGVLESTPSIDEVQFDAWTSVRKDGPMISGLREVAVRHKKLISWGPERGWKEEEDDQVWARSLREALPSVDLMQNSIAITCPA